jgi:hypothetical protein
MTRLIRVAALSIVWFAWTTTARSAIDFGQDILPIFAENCLKCHGPDGNARKAELRLDRGKAGSPLLADPSELIARVNSSDPDYRMPPPTAGPALNQDQKNRLAEWASAGAPWNSSWSLRPIRRPPLPVSELSHPLDRFIDAMRQRHDLHPSEPADRYELIRRASYGLTGLPPAPQEIETFLADEHPLANERMLDRYLASPRYGEHMASFWLDLARFADTNGYHADNHRDMWRWRDWVIEAWNKNLPYDQFTIHQLAGDLLPNATDEMRLATGFHRNSMLMFENGALAEEYLPEYVADRVETTATVWLGQTYQCARCHDHKFDPLTQVDYYRFSAFFGNIDEEGLAGRSKPAEPYARFPTRIQRLDLAELETLEERYRAEQSARRNWAVANPAAYEARLATSKTLPPSDTSLYLSFDEPDGQSDLLDGKNVVGVVKGTLLRLPNGQSRGALLLTKSTRIELEPRQQTSSSESWVLTAWVYLTTYDSMVLYRDHNDVAADGGALRRRIEVRLNDGRPEVSVFGDDMPAWVAKADVAIPKSSWHQLAVRYDAKSGEYSMRIDLTEIDVAQPKTRPPQYVAANAKPVISPVDAPLRGMIDEFRFYSRWLTDVELDDVFGADPVADILGTEKSQRTEAQQKLLVEFYLRRVDLSFREATAAIDRLAEKREEIEERVPTAMIMKERTERRPAFVLERGDYLRPRAEVFPGTPEYFLLHAGQAAGAETKLASRLDLARWIMADQHPLTARVFVNHIWRHHFGQGLVSTAEDFGVRGKPPTHPELLDWLASDLVQSGWDVKRLHRLILTSATYAQTSRVGPDQWKRDPDNQWYSRGPSYRLSAEAIRDTALHAAGLLDSRVLGPSVSPYQPAGIWKDVSYDPVDYSAQVFRQSHGAGLYRRSLYTFWKRSAPPPNMVVFDAPTRETCLVQRSRTNTALQSLVLMNDPTFVEAARVLASRIVMRHETDRERLAAAWLLVMSRPVTNRELSLSLDSLSTLRAHYSENVEDAERLVNVGEYPQVGMLRASELAAWTCVCSVILQQAESLTQH